MLRIVHVLGWFSAAVAVWIASLRSGLPANQHLAVLCVRPPDLLHYTPPPKRSSADVSRQLTHLLSVATAGGMHATESCLLRRFVVSASCC